jgi:hypothetical protein
MIILTFLHCGVHQDYPWHRYAHVFGCHSMVPRMLIPPYHISIQSKNFHFFTDDVHLQGMPGQPKNRKVDIRLSHENSKHDPSKSVTFTTQFLSPLSLSWTDTLLSLVGAQAFGKCGRMNSIVRGFEFRFLNSVSSRRFKLSGSWSGEDKRSSLMWTLRWRPRNFGIQL